MSEIAVSIFCNTYNHGAFIRDALEGFVSQKTNFSFEVLVHDDASTDNTADIIREYEEKYPDIIKPIYQTENQYSKGIKITREFQYPRVKGKYVAYCEGDDYWIDPLKLQKQFDALEKHPEVDICAHASRGVEPFSKKVLFEMAPKNKKDFTIIPVEDVILEGGNSYVATSALFCRRRLIEETPEFRRIHTYDYTMQIWGALRGGMIYFGEVMSEYRTHVPGSWTERIWADKEKRVAHCNRTLNMLEQLDKETDYKYTETIKERRFRTEINVLLIEEKYKEILGDKYKGIIKKYALKTRIGFYIKAYLPFVDKTRSKLIEIKRGQKK